MTRKATEQVEAALVVFGEVLFDCFPDGQKVLGGAPFNVAWALAGFGCDPVFVSTVGDDSEGRAIREKMSAFRMRLDGIGRSDARPTGVVQVRFQGQEPIYEICEDRAWDRINTGEIFATGMIYHGLLALRAEANRASLKQLIEQSNAKRFFDLNLRPPYDDLALAAEWIDGVDWLKLNLDELGQLVGDTTLRLETCDQEVKDLMSCRSVANVLVTGGASGARIFSANTKAACLPAPAVDNFIDAVGAGDAFAASMIRSIQAGQDLDSALGRAGNFAAKVCSLRGAISEECSFY